MHTHTKHLNHRETPIPTDIAEKMIALKRKQANNTRIKDRAERSVVLPPNNPPSPPRRQPQSAQTQTPPVLITRPEPDSNEFSRVLKISPSHKPSPHIPPHKQQGKLFNPDTDPIPIRRTTEPEAMSESTGGSYAPRPPAEPSRHRDATQHRQLFDYRKDDPISFSTAQARKPAPKSSGDYASISSASSYTHSIVSSNFTLSSSTTDESKTSAFSAQLKKLYRDISALETKILADSGEPQDESRIVIKGGPSTGSEEAEKMRWKKAIEDHKLLSEMMLNLLEISLSPRVPVSLRSIPDKYNIIIRLWTNCFYRLLENLRRSSLSSKIAFEYLQEFIYYAYTFYAALLERETFSGYRSGWLEALGDLARYRSVIAVMVPATTHPSSSLTAAAVRGGIKASNVDSTMSPSGSMSTTSSEKHPARPDSPSPSVGIVAARLMELEPEKDRWRRIARDWYAEGVAAHPGHGKLHHHLGLLSREAGGEELRGVYHFVKSMIANHPFETARESVLPLWSQPAQARRSVPDARAPELFVLLHGMLFTKIQLDDFSPTLARLLERLSIEEPEEREWAMMAAVNIGALFEYGRPQGFLRRTGALGQLDRTPAAIATASKVKLVRKAQADERMDVDGDERRRSSDQEVSNKPQGVSAIQVSPVLSDISSSLEPPPVFKMAQELTFTMLAHALRSKHDVPNPYVTILLTFLQAVLRHPEGLATLERAVPWADLAVFLSRGPRISSSYIQSEKLGKGNLLLEDWAVRGMAWPGRLFERGFWDGVEGRLMEMEMLDARDVPTETLDGTWEDDDDNDKSSRAILAWRRAIWASAKLTKIVPGFRWDGRRTWSIDGVLAEKVRVWEEEDHQAAREEEERRKLGRRWMDLDGDELMNGEGETVDNLLSESESEDDEDDPEEIKALKARRRYLRSLLQSSSSLSSRSAISPSLQSKPPRAPRNVAARASLQLVLGYTVLVLDTNILLSSLPMVISLVESLHWTVVVPLPAIMELDGLATNATPLGEAAKAAIAFVASHVRSHADALKVQTSRGNYLSSLSVRSEQIDFDDPDSWERNMDDLILKAAIWQDEHWIDRSAFLKVEQSGERPKGAAKVVLLSWIAIFASRHGRGILTLPVRRSLAHYWLQQLVDDALLLSP
ncbi:hypothetical protein B0F90DRAFT_1911396 [Multifurca ochricompacta]|uniref:PIN domain-containing protein n=1 Tax=Multifurca ochricompacta TaxID=376703 RepID=A0AAD4QM05_9AGAM|nr:hypothetical protein B0F90DRAFT_1911396 [Multifurca ochricompacta]